MDGDVGGECVASVMTGLEFEKGGAETLVGEVLGCDIVRGRLWCTAS